MDRRRRLAFFLAAAQALAVACSADSDGNAARDDSETGDADDDESAEAVRDAAARDGASPLRDGSVDASSAVDAAVDAERASSEDAASSPPTDAGSSAPFSFFVTSLSALRELAKNQNGFGGDLRFGETGEGAGLKGADKICTTIAEKSLPGSGSKVWHAFLSATKGGADGGAAHAIERIGAGPWYDRLGRLIALSKTDLIAARPNSDMAIKNDLPNEDGVPNHAPDGQQVDNHDTLTGSNELGQLYANNLRVTCNDWTKSAGESSDAPRIGHSWPRAGGGGRGGAANGGSHWISSHDAAGCAPGVSLMEMGPPMESNPTVGSGGGYGGFYCFALTP